MDFLGAAYGQGVFIICGTGGIVRRSTDGLVFNNTPAGFASENVTFARFFNNTFVVGSTLGTLAYSVNAGANYSTTDVTGSLTDACFVGGLWVVSGDAGLIRTSPDLSTWTTRTSEFGASNINALATSGSIAISAGAGGVMASSADGVTWTIVPDSSFSGTAINDIAFGLGRWVAVGATGKVATSLDGIAWSQSASPFGSSDINSAVFFDGLWIICGDGGKVAFSLDGLAWELLTDSGMGSEDANALAIGLSRILIAGNADTAVSHSVLYENREINLNIDPQVMLDISGNTRTFDMTQKWRSMGKTGEYNKRVIWRRLGQHRSFTPRIRISSPVKRAVYTAYAKIVGSK